MGKASVKVENGKMVNVRVEDNDVSLTGDFFLEPAEAREEIEVLLRDFETSGYDDLVEAIKSIDAELIGFSADHVVEAFQKARDQEE
ncbi:MAG: hypothetical protein ABEJ72_09555 [Candidatus Aenigmatarchaeota archaeon]